ncbi:hypothetical protein D3C81_2278860 [compost metagenome]
MRFEPHEIVLLQRAAWWEWPIEVISEHLALITAGDVQALHAVAERARQGN